MSHPIPSPSTISSSQFQRALKLYPSVVEKVYAQKLKNDAKKVADAMERDRWRFGELHARVKASAAGENKGGAKVELSKEEVERLVVWKITHGHPRPFLPAMVRKNDASSIRTQTAFAYAALNPSHNAASTPPSLAITKISLSHVTSLTGIGPATGTLILSIFSPAHVPFFQDEMYAWFFGELGGAAKDKAKELKLKYNVKEYEMLFEAVGPVLRRLGVPAVELEKVAYVLGHREALEEGEWEGLGAVEKVEEKVALGDDTAGQETVEDVERSGGKGQAETTGSRAGRKRGRDVPTEEGSAEVGASKRRSQHKK